jgi:hypothetical protein
MCENLRGGISICSGAILMCRRILLFWQFKQSLVQLLMSVDNPAHTNLAEINLLVALAPG